MSSNSRITRSKGPSDGTSLPPYTRLRKDTSTKADNAESLLSSTQQQTACDPLNTMVSHSPFARPGSWAGASTEATTPTGMPSVSASPFARPGSHAGSARSEVDFPSAALQAARSLSCDSPISSIDDTSTSWDVIDPDCDEEVSGITNGQSQHQVNRPANANTHSDPLNQDLGLEQVSDTNSTNNLGTLYNQDFFIADTMNRRLSQIPNKMNYPYPLPNGHAALQLRLSDLLIYLKTDTYLMDVNTGEHYAVYSDKMQKMSVTPKLYSPWGYRQLLHTIQSDALRFGVNSPQPSTSGVSQKVLMTAGPTQPSPVSHYTQPPASPCRREPPKKRLCIDFRKINDLQQKVITEGKSKGCLSLIPLPKIDEMYAKLKGAKFFSTIDLRSGYYHIALGKDSRAKTAFVMPFGKYEFLQVPFGLAQAPAFFQHLMNKVLDNCSFAMTYLDDIIIFSDTEEEHLAHIEEIFRRLEAADLKMK